MRRLLPLFALGCLAATTAAQAQQISPYLAGQNAWMAYSYGARVYNGQLDQLWPVVRKSKVRMVRIGGNGVEFNMPTPQQYLGMIDSIRRIGAEPMVQLPEGRGRYTAQQAAAVVDYVNNQMRRGVKYWIIGNEPNLTGNFGKVTVAGVEAYIKSWATAMKQADPTILTVGPETSFYDTSYLRPLLGGANDVTGKDAHGRYYLDVITFHSYPFSGTQTRAQVLAAANTLAGNVNGLLTMLDAANTLHNRTGSEALQWAVTEFNIGYQNPTANGVDGLGVHGFLNGQYWAEVFGIGMQKGALSMQPWSIHEGNGARGEGDLGYLDGSGAGIKPRSAFYHEMLVAENLHGRYLAATDNQGEVSVVSSRHGDTTAVMVLNKSNTADFDFTVQLSGAAVPGAAPLKINVPAGISASYTDKIYGQSTQVLLFDGRGQLLRKIVYSLQHAASNLAPTYLRPGQTVTLADFRADKTFTCVGPEQVSFAPAVLGTYSSLSWNFGAGATPQTATGAGPFNVSYAAPGLKSVTMTLQNPDTTIVVSKADYVQASACLRTPYAGTAAAVPGVIRAVEFDNGGQNVAYYDSDPTNRGAALNPNVPRPTEAVDTELGDGGLGNIGYSASGEWLRYTVNVQRTGLYKLTVRTAASAAGGSFRVSVDGVDKTGVVPVPATGAFGTYQDIVVHNVYLEASANATLQFDLVSSSFNFSKLTLEEQPAPAGIVVNRLYNASSTPDGMSDAVELLVVKDHQDLRGLIVKDFESNLTSDAGGKYQFRDAALWKDVRIGTTIVLRRLASGITGYAEDLDAADYRVDLLLENGSYLSNLAPNNSFNLTNTDMVLLKTGTAAGTAGAVHAFATGNSNTAIFQAVTSPKLVSAAVTNTGQFQYPLNPAQAVADYNGTAAAASFDANRNWGNGFGAGNVAYIQSLRNAAFTPPGIVVNRVYNGSNDANGQTDAVELLVTQDHFDARNLVVKDFETNNTADNGGKYRFNNIGFWQDLRRGTTIVLRRVSGPAGYQPDLDASDFTLDLLLDNAGYLTNLATGNAFNITQYDMVLLKTGTAAGVAGAIHAFATKGGGPNGVPSALFNSVTAPKLTSPDGTDAGGGTFHYPLNPEQRLQDYAGAQGALSKSTAFTWGYGFGANNAAYIQSLRDSVLAPPAALTATPTDNRVRLNWTASPAAEASGYELYRSATGTSYALLTTLAPDETSFVDSCRSFGARYYYQLRTLGPDLTSRFTPAASVLTEARPALNLPALRGECSVAATAPTTVDLCGGTVTATTTDPTSYAAQGSYAINWLFAFADGSTSTARQSVLVQDQTAPTVRTNNLTVQLDARGQASITAADVNDGSTDACGIQTLALSRTTFGCAQVGPNPVTLTVTDVNGNAATAEAVVTVQDRVAPIVRTRNLTVTLSGGAAHVTVTDIDNGSADACGLELLMLDRTTFDCGNLGPNTVTLTATDVHGNVAAAPATVTVLGAVPAPAIALSRTDHTYTGLPAGTLALGYGAQQLTLTASNPTSAAGATRYQWSPAAGLSSTSSASPTFAPPAAGTYSFTVTATNEFGCVGTAAVTVEVIDARCGNKNDKVLLCHNGNLLCVSANAVAAHLAQHHDQLGGCATAARGTTAGPSAASQADAASLFEAFPNPFAERTTLRFRPTSAGPAQLQVYNALGQLVTTLFDAPAEAGRSYEVTLNGATLKAGVYTCRLLSGGRVETRRVVLVK